MSVPIPESHPHLTKEWHPDKNGDFTPRYITAGSNKYVWWICVEGHEWRTKVCDRTLKGNSCPGCSGRVATESNNLQRKYPLVAKDWHPTKNAGLTSRDVTPKSEKIIWWQCKNGHEWQTKVCNKTKSNFCPQCLSLAFKNSELAKEWHLTKNGDLTPKDVYASGKEKVWWICSEGHEWRASLYSRNAGRGCEKCRPKSSQFELRILAELVKIFPDVEHRKKIFQKECDIFIPSIRYGIEYDSLYWHKKRIDHDINKHKLLSNHGITLINIRDEGLKTISKLDIVYRKHDSQITVIKRLLLDILNTQTLTQKQIDQINNYQHRKIFSNTRYYKELRKRLPKPLPGKSLAEINPQLASEWHPTLNDPLSPKDVFPSASLKIWWLCQEKHKWEQTINHRSRGIGCPFCAGKLASETHNLEITFPHIAKEWHPTKNGNLIPKKVTPKSGKRLWWLCSANHEWEALISDRTNGNGCPFCSGRNATKDNNLSLINPSLAKEWHPTKNGNFTPKDITPVSNKKVWWLCEKNHEWQAILANRVKGNGCPYCSGFYPTKENNLEVNNPGLAKQWDYEKNYPLLPNEVSPFTHKKVWWVCSIGHNWESKVSNRNKLGYGCPNCAKRKTRGV